MEESEFSFFVPRVHFELIPICNLVSDQNYQRDLSRSHIEKTAENFDPNQINPVKVSRRDGMNYVFNGQHTVEIVALASGSRETPVWCMIYDDLSYEHEADIFANQQKYVKPLSALEVFNANIEAGNEQQLLIKSLVESYDLELGNKRQRGMICAVSTLEAIFQRSGYHVLDRVLRILVGTWEGDPISLSGNFLNAVARLIEVYGDKLDELQFRDKVGGLTPKHLARIAKERRAGSMGYAEAMILEYNGKRKSTAFMLPISWLYTKKGGSAFDAPNEDDWGDPREARESGEEEDEDSEGLGQDDEEYQDEEDDGTLDDDDPNDNSFADGWQ